MRKPTRILYVDSNGEIRKSKSKEERKERRERERMQERMARLRTESSPPFSTDLAVCILCAFVAVVGLLAWAFAK